MKRPNLDWFKRLVRYFIHGLAFIVLSILLGVFLVPVLSGLFFTGLFIGLVIGFVVLLIVLGVINTYLTTWLWFPVKRSWKTYFYHGIALFLVLLILGGPVAFLLNLILSSTSVLAKLAVSVVVGAVVNGYLAGRVASNWRKEERPARTDDSPPPTPREVSKPVGSLKPAGGPSGPVKPGSPEELTREEERLEELLQHRKRSDLLNPEALDHVIDLQKRKVEELRKVPAGSS